MNAHSSCQSLKQMICGADQSVYFTMRRETDNVAAFYKKNSIAVQTFSDLCYNVNRGQ